MKPTAYDKAYALHIAGRISRDDLAYTDDVIATLQSNIDIREMADALNIPDHDVLYHVHEVQGWNHRGTVLRSPMSLARTWLGNGRPTEPLKKTRVFPTFPTDPAWWQQRTLSEATMALQRRARDIRAYAQEHGFSFRRESVYTDRMTQRAHDRHLALQRQREAQEAVKDQLRKERAEAQAAKRAQRVIEKSENAKARAIAKEQRRRERLARMTPEEREAYRRRNLESVKRYNANPANKARHNEQIRKAKANWSPERIAAEKERHRRDNAKYMSNPEKRAAHNEAKRISRAARLADPEKRAAHNARKAERRRKLMEDPEYRAKMQAKTKIQTEKARIRRQAKRAQEQS